jgi:integrase
MASEPDIHGWIECGLLDDGLARRVFPDIAVLIGNKKAALGGPTDYDAIFEAYLERSIQISKGGATGRTHSSNKSRATRIISWLRDEVPDLQQLTSDDVDRFLNQAAVSASPKTVRHLLDVFRVLIDRGVALGMSAQNPARAVGRKQSKPTRPRRILTMDEISRLKEASLRHRARINGGLPTVVRFGLYAGLRDEEMVWFRWDAIDWDQRIITIGESHCEMTGKTWVPKDREFRRLDVKQDFITYMEEERQRQTKEEILGPFVLSGQKPFHVDTPQQAFQKMISDEGGLEDITIYSLRHTFATMLLRSAVDIRTVQDRMGHADVRTTMIYLDYVKAEEHPSDALPY